MSIYRISCPARVLLTDTEILELTRVPGGVEVPPFLWCGEEAGHTGRHAVAGQFVGGLTVPEPYTIWVFWPDQHEYGPGRELVVLPPCPVDFLGGHVEGEVCGLYEGHLGRHSWEFGPPLDIDHLTPDLRVWLSDEPLEWPDEP